MRLIGGVLSEDPDERGMEAAWAASSLERIKARRAAELLALECAR